VSASLLEYHVLLALVPGALHGYAIAERVAEESSGALRPRAGSLYRVIARLVGAGQVTETEGVEVAHPGLERRYYALTAAGRRRLAEEAKRLKHTAAVAEKRLGLARGRS
jgi:DNA-binding PadR family transcriptional regulator